MGQTPRFSTDEQEIIRNLDHYMRAVAAWNETVCATVAERINRAVLECAAKAGWQQAPIWIDEDEVIEETKADPDEGDNSEKEMPVESQWLPFYTPMDPSVSDHGMGWYFLLKKTAQRDSVPTLIMRFIPLDEGEGIALGIDINCRAFSKRLQSLPNAEKLLNQCGAASVFKEPWNFYKGSEDQKIFRYDTHWGYQIFRLEVDLRAVADDNSTSDHIVPHLSDYLHQAYQVLSRACATAGKGTAS